MCRWEAVETKSWPTARQWILSGRVEARCPGFKANVPPDATLAVLPEGAMINYLSRHVNPTPCLVWVPPVMAVFGQTNMAAAFEEKQS